MRETISSRRSQTDLALKKLCENGVKTVTLLVSGSKFAKIIQME